MEIAKTAVGGFDFNFDLKTAFSGLGSTPVFRDGPCCSKRIINVWISGMFFQRFRDLGLMYRGFNRARILFAPVCV